MSLYKTAIHRSWKVSYKDLPGHSPAPPVLLIHGFAEDGAIWDQQVTYLQNDHRLIIPDLPGSGASSPISGEISIEEMADCIKVILDRESITQCIMIGHSMGGYIILAFAEKYPDYLHAFGLFHSTAYADTAEKKITRKRGIEFIRKNGSAAFLRQSTPNLFSETSRKERPEIVSALVDRYAGFDPDSLVGYYDAMMNRKDRTAALSGFLGPVLFIIGKQDNTVPFEQSLQQSHMPALSLIYILEHAGHAGMLEDSASSNRAIHEFLQFIDTHH